MKHIYIIIVLWLFALVGLAQQPTDVTPLAATDSDTLSAITSPNYIANRKGYLSKLDTTLFPTGILIDRSAFRTDIHQFNGDDRVKTCSFFIWEKLYRNLTQSCNDTLMMPNYNAFKQYLIGMGRYQNTYIIPILNMQFNTIDKQAYQRGDFTETDSFLVSSGATKASFLATRLLAATPFAGRIHGNDATFMIDSSLFISNIPNEKLQTVEADFDDGLGWQTLQWNIPLTVSYGADSRWVMAKLRLTLQQMTFTTDSLGRMCLKSDSLIQRFVHFNFLHTGTDLVPESAEITDTGSTLKLGKLKDYDEGGATWNAPYSNMLHYGGLSSRTIATNIIFSKTTLVALNKDADPNGSIIVGSTITGSFNYWGYATKGEHILYVWKEPIGQKFDYNILFGAGNSSGKLRKPMIIVDGFDPGNMRDYYQTIIQNPANDTKTDDYRGIYELMNGAKSAWSKDPGAHLCKDLTDAGYDLVFINWTHGDTNIAINAGYLRDFLTDMTEGPNSPKYRDNQTEEAILVGPSMGGLITRYCLTSMEQANEEPHVKLWFSFDSPQEGAYIPIALQWQVKYLSILQPDNQQLQSGIKSLTSDAAQQMILYHYLAFNGHSDQSAGHTQMFEDLYNHFHTLKHPYPLFSKNIAISNGGVKKLYEETADNQICRFRLDMTLSQAFKAESKNNVNLRLDCFALLEAFPWFLGCELAANAIKLKFSTRGNRNHNVDGIYPMFVGSADDASFLTGSDDDYTFNTHNQIGFENAPGSYNTALYDFNQNSSNQDQPDTNTSTHPESSKATFMPTASTFGIPVTRETVYKTWKDIQNEGYSGPFDDTYGTSSGESEEHVRVSDVTSQWLQTYVGNERKSIQKPYRSGVIETESNKCLYTAVNSLTMGGQTNSSFTIRSGADVQALAPHVMLQPGFKVEAGAHFKAVPSTVVNGLKSMVETSATQTTTQSAVSYLTPSQYKNKVYDYTTHELISTVKPKATRNQHVIMYPNPAADELYIECTDSCVGFLNVNIINVLGVVVKTCTIDVINMHVINISSIPTGVYFVQVLCNNKQYSFKLIKE